MIEKLERDFPSEQIIENVEQHFIGKTDVVRKTIICLLANGHLLLEDVPGVGKTTLGMALAQTIDTPFQRIQFTSDLLPSDILGVNVYRSNRDEFEFIEGPIFAGVILADELNRTPPRTQSALLEAMNRGEITVENDTYQLPSPFHVIATQNPADQQGTYPLPENQLDRFLMRLSIGYPARQTEASLINNPTKTADLKGLDPVVSVEEWKTYQKQVTLVRIKDSIVDHILDITRATREHEKIQTGISTRGTLGFARLVKARAIVKGRDYCIPEDVTKMALPSLCHRIVLEDNGSTITREREEAIIQTILSEIPVPVE